MQMKFQKLHSQRKIWMGYNKNALCWAFYCVNDLKNVEGGSLQIMKCIICHCHHVNNFNPSTKDKNV
jgi:hypothetical protein